MTTSQQDTIHAIEACNDISHAISSASNPHLAFYKATPTGAGGILQALEQELQLMAQAKNSETKESVLSVHHNLTQLVYKTDDRHTAAEGFDNLLAEYEEAIERVLTKIANNKPLLSIAMNDALQEHQKRVLSERLTLQQEQAEKEKKFAMRHANVNTGYGKSMREFYAQHPEKTILWQELMTTFYQIQNALKQALQKNELIHKHSRQLQLSLIASYQVERALTRMRTPLLNEWNKKSAQRYFFGTFSNFRSKWTEFNQMVERVLAPLLDTEAIIACEKINSILSNYT